VETDPAEHSRERHLLSNHSQCLFELPFGGEAHIAGHIDACRTGAGAGYKCRLAFRPLDIFIQQGAGGADLNAGAAEFAAGLFERSGNRPGDYFVILIYKAQGADAAQVLTNPDAAGAAYAQIVVLGEQRLVLLYG
jgi:hypothetical protein